MAKRPALGRGLAALLGESDEALTSSTSEQPQVSTVQGVPTSEGSSGGAVVDLPVSSIRANPRQPRRAIDAEGLEELARSIGEVGIVQPVIVRAVDEGYELIAGERRWRAAQKAGFTVVPAIVRIASDKESLELALIENVVRQELNAVDEAFALKVLMDDLGVTQEDLAARVGKSRSAIANKVRLLDLPGPVQESLARGDISEGHGRALLGLKDQGQQVRLARRITARGLSVRQVEAEVRRQGAEAQSSRAPVKAFDDETLDELREVFYGCFGVVPRIRPRGSGGVVELPFKDLEELLRMRDRLASGN